MIKQYLIGIVIIVLALFSLNIIESVITGQFIRERDEKIVIYFPKAADFPNKERGSIVFEFNFPAGSFKVNNKTADILLFLDSETIPGLKLGYDIKEKKIKGGLPVISSGEVSLIDNTPHKIVYTLDNKRQSLYLDGKLVAEGEFIDDKGLDTLTGYSVYRKFTYVESGIGIKTSII